MSRTIVGVCLAAALAAGVSSAEADALLDTLQAIPGMTVVQERPSPAGGRFFLLTYEQPVNHLKPWQGTFRQRVSLLHVGEDRPTVLNSGGYTYSTRPFRSEVASLIDGNQISIEHRFFTPSRPNPADWSDLTIFQQASDDHRLTQALRTLYAGRWLRSGSSKGGMQATYHARFYPQDVDGLVAYVAPNDTLDTHDAYARFLARVGPDPRCRANLAALQRQALLRRNEIVPMMMEQAESWGYTYHQVFGTPDKALELLVIELPFTFWQYYGLATDCTSVPSADASTAAIFEFLDLVQNVALWSDDIFPSFGPYYYQAGTQLGYPKVADAHLADLLRFPGEDVPRSFVPSEIPMPPFQWWAMLDIDLHVRFLGRRQLFVYGELDPWGAEPFRPGPFANDSYTFTIAGANHLVSLGALPEAQYATAVSAIRRWAGLSPLTAAELTTAQSRRQAEPSLEWIERLPRHHPLTRNP